MRMQVRGIVLIIIGLSLIFPLFSRFIVENLVVVLGVYLIYLGYCTITGSTQKEDQSSNRTDES